MVQSSKFRPHTKAVAQKKRTDDLHAKNEEERVFEIQEISMGVPRGQLVAIVGPVGSGKTSLLQGLIGEMRKTDGSSCLVAVWGIVRRLRGYRYVYSFLKYGLLRSAKICLYPECDHSRKY